MMSDKQAQLTLHLSPQELYRLDNFLFAQAETEQAVRNFCFLQDPCFLYLYGAHGTGKTHVLIACAEAVQQAGHRAIYVSLRELMQSSEPAILEALEHTDLLCIDDIDEVVGHTAWEEALFHCFNRLQAMNGHLLLAAQANARSININLPDLRSRLATGLAYALPDMQDEQKQRAMMLQSKARGLTMNQAAADYLLRRYERDMPTLINVLQQLDKASLQAKRRLTIPFIKQVLGHD